MAMPKGSIEVVIGGQHYWANTMTTCSSTNDGVSIELDTLWPFPLEPVEPDPPTVTLHNYRSNMTCNFSIIEKIEQDRPFSGASVFGHCMSRDGCAYEVAYMAESPAEITAIAREAWGAEWSCPGAEPPVVVLSCKCGDMKWRRVTGIRMSPLDTPIISGLYFSTNTDSWQDTGWGLYADMTVAELRAACEKAGMPRVAEEAEPAPEPEYPEAWTRRLGWRDVSFTYFEAYGCHVEIFRQANGWGYSIDSADYSHGAHTTLGNLSKKDAIATADAQAKAWGKQT